MKFEGEYVNGLRNGKGKEYNFDGKLLFEGEYLNGLRWNGKGIEINYGDCPCELCTSKYEVEYLLGQKKIKI